MINHPSAGLANGEAQRQELLALAARERQARLVLLGTTSNAAREPAHTRWARFVARLPLAIRPVIQGASPTTGPSLHGGPSGRLRLPARIVTPCLVALLVLPVAVMTNHAAATAGALLSESAGRVEPND